jgi:hypothetical protein
MVNIYLIGENHKRTDITKNHIESIKSFQLQRTKIHYFIEGLDNYILKSKIEYNIVDITDISMLDIPLLSDFGFYIYIYGFICGITNIPQYYTLKKNIKKMKNLDLPDQTNNIFWKRQALSIILNKLTEIMKNLDISTEYIDIIIDTFRECVHSLNSNSIAHKAVPITENFRDEYFSSVINSYYNYNKNNNEVYIVIVGSNHIDNMVKFLSQNAYFDITVL